LKTLGLIVVLLFAAGCSPFSTPKTAVQTLPNKFEPIPAGHALVVFARTQKAAFGNSYGSGQPFFVVDDQGKFLGEIPADARLHVVVPAGVHTFVGWHHAALGDYGQSTLVTGKLTAGRAYYVEVQQFEFPMQLVSRPFALSQRSYADQFWSDWKVGQGDCRWLEDVYKAQRVGPDPEGARAHGAEKIREQIDEARERFADRNEDGAALVWKFHDVGGTFETFFVDELRQKFMAAVGAAGCARLAEAEFQKLPESDFEAWEDTYDKADLDLDLERIEK